MKSVAAVVANKLVEKLKGYGFEKKGNAMLYVRMNEIIGLLAFERPTDRVNFQFAIIPLFLPCPGFIYYSFGRRLNHLYRDLPWIEKASSAEEVEEFCELAFSHIEKDIIPLLKTLSTAEGLFRFAKRRTMHFRHSRQNLFIQCTPEHGRQLLLYCCLRIKDYKRAIPLARKSLAMIENDSHMPPWKEQQLNEVRQVVEMLGESRFAEIEQKLEENVAKNIALFRLK